MEDSVVMLFFIFFLMINSKTHKPTELVHRLLQVFAAHKLAIKFFFLLEVTFFYL